MSLDTRRRALAIYRRFQIPLTILGVICGSSLLLWSLSCLRSLP